MLWSQILAGIVDCQGGIRVVVTSSANIHYHVGDGERLYIVPDFVADQWMADGRYVEIIEKAMQYVRSHED